MVDNRPGNIHRDWGYILGLHKYHGYLEKLGPINTINVYRYLNSVGYSVRSPHEFRSSLVLKACLYSEIGISIES